MVMIEKNSLAPIDPQSESRYRITNNDPKVEVDRLLREMGID